MADNNYRANRSRDPNAREDAELSPGDLGDNPLADLARLIGQRERVNEFDRGARHNGAVQTLEQSAADQDWAEDERYAEQPQHDAEQPQHYAEESYVEPRLPDYPQERGYAQYEDTRAPAPRYAEPAGYADPRGQQQAYEQQTHESHDYQARYQDEELAYDEQYGDDPHDETRSYAPRYRDEDEQPRTLARQAPGLAPQAHEQYDEQWDDQHDDQSEREEYDEDTGPKRHNGLAIVLALLGLVLIGAAGAYAYRATFGGAILVPSLPPIIKPADGPNKIVPAPAASASSNAALGANPSAPAQLVPREEQPVPVQPPPAPPRVLSTIPVAPAPGAPPAAPVAPSFQAPPAGPAPAAPKVTAPAQTQGTPEPKKIHTVPIRPDQMGDAAAGAPTALGPAAATPAAAPRARAAEPPPRSAPPPHGGNAPLSLVPGNQSAAPAIEPPRTRVARTEASAGAPVATAPAAAASPPATGGYSVQVSSQRSEAEARSAFRELQGKYPSQLGSRQPIIHQADLGAKGTYYRAMVGPFGSAEAAASLCSSLKAAGGSCIVQKN